MEYEAECLVTLAQLLERPDRGFAAYVGFATDPALMPPVVAGQLALFAERVADLSLEERQELFVETFVPGRLADLRGSIANALRKGPPFMDGPCLARSVDQLREVLLTRRNPYAHLLTGVSTMLALVDSASV
jgi:nitrate reductase assembly molybdenum cofactor insertion protein NarJ